MERLIDHTIYEYLDALRASQTDEGYESWRLFLSEHIVALREYLRKELHVQSIDPEDSSVQMRGRLYGIVSNFLSQKKKQEQKKARKERDKVKEMRKIS